MFDDMEIENNEDDILEDEDEDSLEGENSEDIIFLNNPMQIEEIEMSSFSQLSNESRKSQFFDAQ